jgi:small multidrug resistance pump
LKGEFRIRSAQRFPYYNSTDPSSSGIKMNQWLFLSIAIISEVVATSALKSSAGFTQLWPSLLVIAGYAAAFFFLSLTLRTMPVGVAYAIWSGVGIVLITLIAWIVLGQSLDGPAVFGLALIVAGVVVLNVFSKSAINQLH